MSYQSLGYNGSYASVPQQRIFSSNGAPLVFFVPYDEPRREEYVKLIGENGGEIAMSPDVQGQHAPIWLTSSYNENLESYNLDYITESLKQGLQLDIHNFKWNAFEQRQRQHQQQQQFQQQQLQQQQLQQQQLQQQQLQQQQQYQQQYLQQQQHLIGVGGIVGMGIPVGGLPVLPQQQQYQPMPAINNLPTFIQKRGTNSKNSFTPDEDELILDRVRRDPKRRTSHKLFDEIAKELTNHTGNSIRYRYRNQLESKLGFVYRTNPKTGALVTDINGNLIRESMDNLPKTLKTKFTAADDKALCEGIIQYNMDEYQKQVEDGMATKPLDINGPLTVPVSFFRDLERKHPSHTKSAWRDRYRKFAAKYGFKKYVDYCNSTDNPQPMKDFTRRRKTALGDLRAAKQLIGSSKNRTQAENAQRESINAEEDEVGALDEEIGEIKSSNIDEALLRNRRKQKEPKSKQAIQESDSDDDEEVFLDAKEEAASSKQVVTGQQGDGKGSQLVELLSQPANTMEETQEVAFTYPHSKMTIDHLFGAQFFNSKRENIIKILGDIIEVGDTNTGNLFFQLENKLGFTELFSTIIILYTGGDYQKIWEYVNAVINNIYDENLAIEENETYKILEIEGINGVWNKRYDELLLSGDKDSLLELKRIHLPEMIEARLEFLGQARKEDQVI